MKSLNSLALAAAMTGAACAPHQHRGADALTAVIEYGAARLAESAQTVESGEFHGVAEQAAWVHERILQECSVQLDFRRGESSATSKFIADSEDVQDCVKDMAEKNDCDVDLQERTITCAGTDKPLVWDQSGMRVISLKNYRTSL